MNRKIKTFIKRGTRILPDKIYLSLSFFWRQKKWLNLKSPCTFNEKIQWLKINDRKPIYTKLVDKYEVRNFVQSHLGENVLVPLVGGPWNSVDEIDFSILPNQFVLKCTHDSGGIVVCRNKEALDISATKIKLQESLQNNYFWGGREWPYKNVEPRIIAEKLMTDETQKEGLIDYKFYCFNGEPKCLYVSVGLENHATAKISFLNMDWSFADFRRRDYQPLEELPRKPKCYEEMIKYARVLSEGIPFVRVDLYEVDGEIFFSELTFSPSSGMMPFDPPEADIELGRLLHLF